MFLWQGFARNKQCKQTGQRQTGWLWRQVRHPGGELRIPVDSHACLDVGPVEIDLSIEYTPTWRDRELLGEFNPELGIHSRRAAACCLLAAQLTRMRSTG